MLVVFLHYVAQLLILCESENYFGPREDQQIEKCSESSQKDNRSRIKNKGHGKKTKQKENKRK